MSVKADRKKSNSTTKTVLDSEISGLPTTGKSSFFDTTSFLMSQDDYLDWYEEALSELTQAPRTLTRTELLTLDYKQFKAARVIQRYLRRWYYRRIYQRKRRAAIIIQTEWRRFYEQRRFFCKLETTLSERMKAHYNRKAQMIQALWRGYWARQTIHDHRALHKTQVATAEDLLQCVAFKLHHLLRTYQIPGVYSLRNSHCLSKVEKLLASFSFKLYNDKARLLHQQRQEDKHQAQRTFGKSKFQTCVPYQGPNILTVCPPICETVCKDKDIDRRMFRIINTFQNATKDSKKVAEIKQKHKKIKDKGVKAALKKVKPTDFCTDIVMSMKRWNVLDEHKIAIDPNIFKQPDKLDKFLREIDSIYEAMQRQCKCGVQPADLSHCL